MNLHKGSDDALIDLNNAICDSLALISTMTDSDTLHHSWVELSDAVYPLGPPPLDKVSEWKSFFAKIEGNELRSAYKLYTSYKSPEQFIAVRDLMEVWLWQKPESREDMTLWRLLQLDTTTLSLSVDKKVYSIRDQIDSLLDYNTGINVEMSNRAALLEKLYGFYDDLVLRCVLQNVSKDVGAALKQEQELWLEYHSSAMKTFETINDHSGSAFPQWLYGFGVENHKLRRLSQEDFLFILYTVDEPLTIDREVHSKISDEQIAMEYKRFANDFVDLSEEGLGATIEEQRAVLEKEFEAWTAWLKARNEVSSLLPSKLKEVYDYSTDMARRGKLFQITNRTGHL